MSAAPPTSFPALRQPVFRAYFAGAASLMMADSIEHVISYWMMFEKFHSPALAGFAVISHWVPFLLLSIWSGALADRYDPRRLIQLGMAVFMGVSIAWGLLFLADALEMWHAAVLLIFHGLAGVIVCAAAVQIRRQRKLGVLLVLIAWAIPTVVALVQHLPVTGSLLLFVALLLAGANWKHFR